MAGTRKRNGNAAGEYAGTEPGSGGITGEVISGGSEPIEPDAAAGLGNGSHSGERDSAGREFDASIHSGERNANGEWARRRGRKRGGNNAANHGPRKKTSAADLSNAIEALTKTLVIVHAGLSVVTKTPELVIDDEEGTILAKATANVLDQFDLKPDPKIQAIVGLIVACGTVYAPRVALVKMRHEQEKKEKKANASGVGTAGVYAADGTPMGTTEFQAEPQLKWPPDGHVN